MASAITHIVLTEEVYPKYFSNLDRSKFYMGTCFPDIRYFGVIGREKTHLTNLTINKLIGTDSFETGLMFHSLLDDVREKFVRENEVYSVIPEDRINTQALKFYEDELLYGKIGNWQEYKDILEEKLTEEELKYGISDGDILSWHYLVSEYLASPPSDNTRERLLSRMRFPQDQINEINALVSKYHRKPKLEDIVLNLYKYFEYLIDQTST